MAVRLKHKNVIFLIGKVPSENLPSLTQTLPCRLGGPSGPIFLPKRSPGLWGGPSGPIFSTWLMYGSVLCTRIGAACCSPIFQDGGKSYIDPRHNIVSQFNARTINVTRFGKLGRKVPGSAAGALSKLVPRGSTSATDPSEDDTHDSTEPPVSNDDSDEEPSSDDDVYKRRRKLRGKSCRWLHVITDGMP